MQFIFKFHKITIFPWKWVDTAVLGGMREEGLCKMSLEHEGLGLMDGEAVGGLHMYGPALDDHGDIPGNGSDMLGPVVLSVFNRLPN